MKVKIKRFDKDLPLPHYERMAAGFDFICRDGATVAPGALKAIHGNVAMEIPDGYVLLIMPRSSTPARTGLTIIHAPTIIDPFWRGDDNEIILIFYNFTDKPVSVRRGDRLAHGVLIKYEKAEFEEVDSLTKKARQPYKLNEQRK